MAVMFVWLKELAAVANIGAHQCVVLCMSALG